MKFSSTTTHFALSPLMIALIFAAPIVTSPQPLRARTIYSLEIKTSPQSESSTAQDQEANPTTAGVGTLIRWRARPGVERYRLQLALDNAFNDIVFDRAVIGNSYQVTELPQGRYYWRIAPATTETEAYTVVGVVVIAGANEREVATNDNASNTSTASVDPGATPTPRPSPTASPSPSASPLAIMETRTASNLLSPPPNTGWQTAIGESISLDLTNINSTSALIATNADGAVYFLDATRGVARWVSGFNPEQRRGETIDREQVGTFAPVYVAAMGETATAEQITTSTSAAVSNGDGVLVKFTNGVRLVDASSGREVWRTRLEGNARGAAAATANATKLMVATRNPDRLYFINRRTGRIERQQDLDSPLVGAPLTLVNSIGTEFLIGTQNGLLAFYDSSTTEPTRSVKLDARITTAPLSVASASGARLLVGTERGLIALQAADLSPVWRIATEGEPPTGVLAKADLERDGVEEVVFITTRGRAAAVDVERGVIKWVAEGAGDAMGAAFADLDNDGVLDVIVGARDTFAIGYSGRDGKPVWSTQDVARAVSTTQTDATARASSASGRKFIVVDLPVAGGAGNSLFLVGADSQRTSLRAIRLTPVAKSDAGKD